MGIQKHSWTKSRRNVQGEQNSCHHPKNLYVCFLKMLNQKVIPATRSSPTLTAQRNPFKRYGIRTTTKPLRTLEQDFPSPKDRPLPEKQTNVIYKINCADCSWSYIGETGRALETRKKEHKRNVKQCKSGSNIAKHAWTQNHNINFDECKVLDKATYRHRATLESWHTATTANSDNNAQHLPEQYRFLLEKNRS